MEEWIQFTYPQSKLHYFMVNLKHIYFCYHHRPHTFPTYEGAVFAGQPGEDAVVGARNGDVQLLDADVEGGRPVHDVALVLGHLGAARLAAVVGSETVALEEVPQRDVVTSVVQHLDYTAGVYRQ